MGINQVWVSFQEIVKTLKTIMNLHKVYVICVLIGIVLTMVQPFIMILFPRYIIDEITIGGRFSYVVWYVFGMGISLLFVNGLLNIIQPKQEYHGNILMQKVSLYVGKISMGIELSKLEQADNSDKIEMAKESQKSIEALSALINIIAQTFTAVGLVAIVSSYHIGLFFVTLVVLMARLFSQYKVSEGWAKGRKDSEIFSRRGAYLREFITSHSGAKEIRLHGIKKWLYDKILEMTDKAIAIEMKQFRSTVGYAMAANILFEISILFYYVVLTRSALQGTISVGDFVMYITTITSLSTALKLIADSVTTVQRSMTYLGDFRALNEMKSEDEKRASSEPILFSNYDICFDHVSFRYPGAVKDALHDVNIEIPQGQKLAVVGPNGAGKTTFIKLLCGFYKPTEGRILIGGHDIKDMSYLDMIQCIGAAFQDFQTFSFSVKENIAVGSKIEKKRIQEILEKLQLADAVAALPAGIDTMLYKDFDENGIEFSGGQMQKLAIARAMYKQPQILILDEPTANLDALVEYEIYKNMEAISEGKTSIMISHRLSSSKNCDQIAVFADGAITEYGTHEKLIEQDGLYADMFKKQAQYYVRG